MIFLSTFDKKATSEIFAQVIYHVYNLDNCP